MELYVKVMIRYITKISKACDRHCKSCFGPNITDCLDCYPPYSIDKENTECVFNETLAEIMWSKYQRVIHNEVDYI